ncbi:MAG: hypothetical protein KBT28_06910 [Bacteroidales bacterium]|nr:hypothetical protein [Candidatus Colimorpha merdihippi]
MTDIDKITEKVIESEDYDNLVRNYGNEYLIERNCDDELFNMDDINEILCGKLPIEILNLAYFGGNWTPHSGESGDFNTQADYFYFNGYGNLVSVDEYYYTDYLKSVIDEEYFVEFLIDNDYIDIEDYLDEEDDEEEDEDDDNDYNNDPALD